MIPQNQSNAKQITIVITDCNKKSQQVKMNLQATKFCNFFDPEVVNQQSQYPDLVFKFSYELGITVKNVQLLNTFMEMHNYDLKEVEQNKKLVLKAQNDVENSIKHPTTKFVHEYLEEMPKIDLLKLKKTCNFFQVQSLSKVINLFLASKYDPGINETKVKEELAKLNLQNYNREELNQLKCKYFEFFQKFGKKLIEQHLNTQQEQ